MHDIITRMKSSWKNWRKNSLQLDLDPTPFTSHRQYCWLSADGLISDVELTVLDVEAPERQACQQLPHKLQRKF